MLLTLAVPRDESVSARSGRYSLGRAGIPDLGTEIVVDDERLLLLALSGKAARLYAEQRKSESCDILLLMVSERASSDRQRYAGKVCCECSRSLPPPHRRGERLCDQCAGLGRKRVYMHFMLRKNWLCQFVEEDLKTALPKQVVVADEKKIWEMAKRGGFTLNIAGRQELDEKVRKGSGGIWLDLTAEQYRKLK